MCLKLDLDLDIGRCVVFYCSCFFVLSPFFLLCMLSMRQMLYVAYVLGSVMSSAKPEIEGEIILHKNSLGSQSVKSKINYEGYQNYCSIERGTPQVLCCNFSSYLFLARLIF